MGNWKELGVDSWYWMKWFENELRMWKELDKVEKRLFKKELGIKQPNSLMGLCQCILKCWHVSVSLWSALAKVSQLEMGIESHSHNGPSGELSQWLSMDYQLFESVKCRLNYFSKMGEFALQPCNFTVLCFPESCVRETWASTFFYFLLILLHLGRI